MNPSRLMKSLLQHDTPSVTNVVATYPKHPLCLNLYDPWRDRWYTDQSLRCMFPEWGRRAGYVVTCVFGLPAPTRKLPTFLDVLDAMDASPKPTVLVARQEFPRRIAGKVGLFGGNMVSAMRSVGCVGVITDGPSRDLDEVRPLRFQYLMTGATAGHGDFAVRAVNVRVTVAGMDAAPGEIVHMDENGACKFPADRLADVVANLAAMQKEEVARMAALQRARSAAEIRRILAPGAYGARPRRQAASSGRRKAS